MRSKPSLSKTSSTNKNNENDSSTTTLLTFKPQNTQQGAQNGDNSGFDDRFVIEVDGEDDGEDADIEDDDNNDRDDGRDSPGATPGDTNQVNRDDAEVSHTQNDAAFPSTFDFQDDSSDNGVDADNSSPSNKFPPKRRKAVHLAFHPTPPQKKPNQNASLAAGDPSSLTSNDNRTKNTGTHSLSDTMGVNCATT